MNGRSFKTLPTTRFDRFLLGAVIVSLPFDATLGNLVPNVSTLFLVFGGLGVYALVRHPRTLVRILLHPVFLVGYVFLLGSGVIEMMHANSDFSVLSRTGQMFLGGAVIASYCRDPESMRTALYSFLFMGIAMAILLFLSVFGAISAITISNPEDLGELRSTVFEERLMGYNTNGMAYFATLGTVVALVLWTTSRPTVRHVWLVVTVLGCLVAVFLTMSRSGIFIVMVLSALILFLRNMFRLRTLFLTALFAFSILVVVPDVVFLRMRFTIEPHPTSGRREGRAQVLVSSLETISEEPLWGVGTGNFWGYWGEWSGFYSTSSESIAGAHTTFFQIIIYWGVFPLLIWLIMFWTAFRCIPRPFGTNRVTLFLFALFMWLFLESFFSHNFYGKEFSLVLGVLAGFDQWIRPFYKANRPGIRDVESR